MVNDPLVKMLAKQINPFTHFVNCVDLDKLQSVKFYKDENGDVNVVAITSEGEMITALFEEGEQ